MILTFLKISFPSKKKSIQRNSIRMSIFNTDKRTCMHAIKSFISKYLFCAEGYAQCEWCLYKQKQSNCVLFFFTIKHLTNKRDLNSIKLPKCPYRRTKFHWYFDEIFRTIIKKLHNPPISTLLQWLYSTRWLFVRGLNRAVHLHL